LINKQLNTFQALETITVQAPGRSCLFGDHQDYLGLPVIACAIDRHITLVAKRKTDKTITIEMPNIGQSRSIDLEAAPGKVEKGDHLLAAMRILEEYGCVPDAGYDIEIKGNIAINAGTSSSSALVVAWTHFLLAAFGCERPITKEFIARVSYEAEVEFHGSPGGKMDQYSIGLGNIIFLETGEEVTYEVFEKELPGLIVAESGIPKQTTGVLGELKEKALLAINKVREKVPGFDLKKVKIDEFPMYVNYVPDHLKVYLEAALLNHDITQKALVEFKRPQLDLEKIGALINEHHKVLKDYLKITLPLIDNMVDAALGAGALGAKIVGSGRGGSIVVLSRDGQQQRVIKALKDAGAKDAYAVNIDPGAHVINTKP